MHGRPIVLAIRRRDTWGACRSIPAVHIDPIGTLLFPLIAMMTNVPLIGWAKPVPVDLRHLKHPKRDFALIAAAGPASNILMAVDRRRDLRDAADVRLPATSPAAC